MFIFPMKPSSLWLFPVLLFCVSSTACRSHGERVTQSVVEDRVLSLSEFRQLFRADQLNAHCCWYYGSRTGYSYIEIDDPQPIDLHDDMFNRRIHHTLRRFRVSERDVTFMPAMAFSGYEKGTRIVSPAFAGEHRTTFQVLTDE